MIKRVVEVHSHGRDKLPLLSFFPQTPSLTRSLPPSLSPSLPPSSLGFSSLSLPLLLSFSVPEWRS